MSRFGAIVGRVLAYLGIAASGGVLGAIAIHIHLVRSGPALEIWHRAFLEGEFTATSAGKVETLEDYRGLEERLFADMDKIVYSAVPTGPGWELARYSSGSAADPRGRAPDWNRTVELTAENPAGGVLLLHGMSDAPYSLRALGESLHRRGHHVLALRLPGHGTLPSGLATVHWEDMAAAVRLGMAHLADVVGGRPVHVIGYSTGAPLAVHHALQASDDQTLTMPASLVLISPALGITPAAALAVWKNRLARLPGLEKLAWAQIQPEFDPYKYNSFAINAGDQVHRLTRAMADTVRERAAAGGLDTFPPTLIFQSTVDATVTTRAVIDNLLGRLAPGRHEFVLFDINRRSVKNSVLVPDPGPLTAEVVADSNRPFHLTVISNENPESRAVVSRRKAPFAIEAVVEPLGLAWPANVFSLSHVALPFPPDDPLYGSRRAERADPLHLGQIRLQGERGLLAFPADFLLRLRHNPFYDYLDRRTIAFVEESG